MRKPWLVFVVIGLLVAQFVPGITSSPIVPQNYLKWEVTLHPGEWVEWCDNDTFCAYLNTNAVNRLQVSPYYLNGCLIWTAEKFFVGTNSWVQTDGGTQCYTSGVIRTEDINVPFLSVPTLGNLNLKAYWDSTWPNCVGCYRKTPKGTNHVYIPFVIKGFTDGGPA